MKLLVDDVFLIFRGAAMLVGEAVASGVVGRMILRGVEWGLLRPKG